MSTNATYPDSYRAPNRMGVEPDPVNRYGVTRTPSPTPSEVRALTTHIIDFKRYGHWRFWARKEWIKYYIIGGIILVITILISVYDKQIVKWLTPAGNWMRRLKFGWLIPIGILFVISFPPLFGHEIVALFVGVIWGLGIGFAIVCAGTFLGELGNFFAFKYLCRSRAEKAEKSSIFYACLAQMVRDGGFKMAVMIRLSVIPGHFSTAVFATCGMSVWIFSLAAFLSLPKQLITVYIGVILEESGTGTETSRDKIISDSVLGVTILITALAMWYIVKEMERVKPIVVYARRKNRQAKFIQDPATMLLNRNGSASPSTSETDIAAPLAKRLSTQLGNILGSGGRPEQLRRGSGANMGYGGYTPTFIQGKYGEPASDHDGDDLYERFGVRKSVDHDDVGWEMTPAKTIPVNINASGKDLNLEYGSGGKGVSGENMDASSNQTSLLPHHGPIGNLPPRTWTPERYTTSPDAFGQRQQQPLPSSIEPSPSSQAAQVQAHFYPPALKIDSPATTIKVVPNLSVHSPPQLPSPQQQQQQSTHPSPYQQNPYPTQERRVFQLSDPPVSRSLQQIPSHTPDDSTLLPYAAHYQQPSIPSLDRPFDNPYDPSYQYSLYPPSHTAYPTTSSADQTDSGNQFSTSTSSFSNASSDQSYSEHTSLTTPNPHPPSYYPS